MGEIESIYLRDPDKNLIELSNYKSKQNLLLFKTSSHRDKTY